jgi:hypothetical protein
MIIRLNIDYTFIINLFGDIFRNTNVDTISIFLAKLKV